jgi:hypothetical protein
MLDLYSRFAPFFPIGDGLVRLELVELDGSPRHDSDDLALVVLRLIVFEDRGGQPMIRDIKEQEIRCGSPSSYDNRERVEEMLHAQRVVLGELLRGPVDRFDTLMPADLLHTDVMSLARANTRDDFARALRAKRRLGKFFDSQG